MMKILLLIILFVISTICCSQNSEIEKTASKIHNKVLTIDSHTDTPLRFLDSNFDIGKNDENYKGKVNLPKMKKGGLDAVFFAVFLGQRDRTKEGNEKAKKDALEIFDAIYKNIEKYPELAEIATSPDDAYRIEKKGKRAIYIGIENGFPIGNDTSNISMFYKLGARYITLCHTKNNDICDSSTDSLEHGGLSEFGKLVVEKMNDIGMMIDVSHISDNAFYDVIKLSKTPVIASHSCSRAICNNPRNLSDEMLKKLAENGGVIQMCILSDYVKKIEQDTNRINAQNELRIKYNSFKDLSDKERNAAIKEWYGIDDIYPARLAKVKDVVDHIEHIIEVIGVNHVGIGTDFDGGGGVEDCFDVSQMKNITIELVKRGYTEEDIRKIWGGNFIRVFRDVEELRIKKLK